MKKLLCIFLIVLAFGGCAVSDIVNSTGTGIITLMTWNIHNLFDGKDDGYEYPEFLLSAGWSEEKYRGRLNTISNAIHIIIFNFG